MIDLLLVTIECSCGKYNQVMFFYFPLLAVLKIYLLIFIGPILWFILILTFKNEDWR